MVACLWSSGKWIRLAHSPGPPKNVLIKGPIFQTKTFLTFALTKQFFIQYIYIYIYNYQKKQFYIQKTCYTCTKTVILKLHLTAQKR